MFHVELFLHLRFFFVGSGALFRVEVSPWPSGAFRHRIAAAGMLFGLALCNSDAPAS